MSAKVDVEHRTGCHQQFTMERAEKNIDTKQFPKFNNFKVEGSKVSKLDSWPWKKGIFSVTSPSNALCQRHIPVVKIRKGKVGGEMQGMGRDQGQDPVSFTVSGKAPCISLYLLVLWGNQFVVCTMPNRFLPCLTNMLLLKCPNTSGRVLH